MPDQVTISQLNRQAVIKKYIFGQDSRGGNIKALVSSFTIAARIEQISNYYALEQLQIKYGEAYKIIFRYEPSRILTANDEIEYDNKLFKIRGITNQQEGNKRFIIIIASCANTSSNTGTGTYVVSREYHYSATGGEYSFASSLLIGWTNLIILFRDGIEYRVIQSGVITGKQALYDSGMGTFTFSNLLPPLEPGEAVDIYFIV